MKALRRDDRFRFSLQWRADTEEKARVGALLERMGNKKSDFIVMAVVDYLERHPEMEIPGSKIKITYHPLHTKDQLLSMVRDMVKNSMSEFMERKPILPEKITNLRKCRLAPANRILTLWSQVSSCLTNHNKGRTVSF